MSKPWTVERVSSFTGLAEARPREAAREIVENFIVKSKTVDRFRRLERRFVLSLSVERDSFGPATGALFISSSRHDVLSYLIQSRLSPMSYLSRVFPSRTLHNGIRSLFRGLAFLMIVRQILHDYGVYPKGQVAVPAEIQI
jgi:hypothetical protein